MTSSQNDVVVDQFLMRLGYAHDTELDEVAVELERLREERDWLVARLSDSQMLAYEKWKGRLDG